MMSEVTDEHVIIPLWTRFLEARLVRIDEELKFWLEAKSMPPVSTVLKHDDNAVGNIISCVSIGQTPGHSGTEPVGSSPSLLNLLDPLSYCISIHALFIFTD